jgi:Cysteine-rich secretory protein family
LSTCPRCIAANSFVSTPPPRLKNKITSPKLVSSILIAIVAVIVIILLSPVLANFLIEQKEDPTIKILQPQSQLPKSVPREELIQHVLDMINRDRIKFGLLPVKLSTNQAAQAQAEDVFKTKQISHWNTKGEKPYMTYTEYGGKGGMQQNVAIAGFSTEEYKQCIGNILVDCEKIKPLSTVDELQYEMMYNDKECCDNGHRNNILDPRHTHVSIGIVYDDYYLAFVQNFENNYGLNVDVKNSKIAISGTLLDGQLDHIGIYYDKMPTREIYEQNKHLLSYSTGDLVALAVKPLPPGYYYKSLQGYNIIEANKWTVQGRSINVMFDLADAVDKDGVYTLFTVVKDGEEMFDVTSYSVFVNSEKNN